MNLGGQRNLTMIFQSPSRQTVSKALVTCIDLHVHSVLCFSLEAVLL